MSTITPFLWFDGQAEEAAALNGGPVFRFSPAVSFVVHCKTQAEVDHYREKLGAGGAPEARQCGWLADRFGLSWQIVPGRLIELLSGSAAAAGRVMEAMMRMKKIDSAAPERAAQA